jgi:23S rRNA pseudouridine1911/1915/1917 synthase
VLARTEAASKSLLEQFRSRSVAKRYRAIVHGAPRFDTGWIEARIGRSPRARERRCVVGERGETSEGAEGAQSAESKGRDALTFYRVLERFEHFGLLDCIPKTGRTHQIRVHLEHEGHPIVGDPLYNKRRSRIRPLPEEAPRISRQALHAAELAFRHPRTGDQVRFECDPPADMEALLSWIRSKS